MRAAVFFLSILVVATGAHADVVRCVDANGRVSYTDGPCPAGSRLSRQVPIAEYPPPDETRRPDDALAAPRVPAPAPGPPPPQQQPSLTVIPRSVEEPAPPPSDAIYTGGPIPYYDGGGRPIYRPRPPRPLPNDPPPGRRPCPNLAGLKRNNC